SHANGHPVSQSNVVVPAAPSPWGVTARSNTATSTLSLHDALPILTLSGTAGTYTLSFGGTGLTPVSSGPIALSAGAAASMAPNEGGRAAPGTPAATPPPTPSAPGASGNPVSGVAVTFAASPGSGTV